MTMNLIRDIPAEIRLKIYQAYFEDMLIYVYAVGCTITNNDKHEYGMRREDKHSVTNLYLTCRTFYQEAGLVMHMLIHCIGKVKLCTGKQKNLDVAKNNIADRPKKFKHLQDKEVEIEYVVGDTTGTSKVYDHPYQRREDDDDCYEAETVISLQ
ncbi:hypothetical protein LTR05_008252 [Lithohypha guttulata]|uniref:Uncharacterized protein n=1 Tax=Lithohypha guttulata TaxID=1690604 RepID=A0AAN7STC7_9EURO|nr:hypothetical protein LTR05_008252 [Lithohypha guttulata]